MCLLACLLYDIWAIVQYVEYKLPLWYSPKSKYITRIIEHSMGANLPAHKFARFSMDLFELGELILLVNFSFEL